MSLLLCTDYAGWPHFCWLCWCWGSLLWWPQELGSLLFASDGLLSSSLEQFAPKCEAAGMRLRTSTSALRSQLKAWPSSQGASWMPPWRGVQATPLRLEAPGWKEIIVTCNSPPKFTMSAKNENIYMQFPNNTFLSLWCLFNILQSILL